MHSSATAAAVVVFFMRPSLLFLAPSLAMRDNRGVTASRAERPTLACAARAAAIRRISPGGAGLIVALFTAGCADDASRHQCTAPGNAAAPGEVELEPARDHESMSFPARQRHPGVARASRLRCDAHRSPMSTARWMSRAV